MAYRVSDLNLVVDAIVLWNRIYLWRTIDDVCNQRIIIPDERLSSVAPFLWGIYRSPIERYKSVRTKHLNLQIFTFLGGCYCKNDLTR
ncbi:Tn3 family transposase [Serratia marcescens]|uniref:Tn3 family transposase n=1 Tax=Serratia marcescens TaxID=615 RepID=A0A5C7BN72_SERMA|nr:Tn3 family transposase [Serratia marcescens]TXE53327.1 Tn3 family transposase [Serratia marcescens]